MNEYRWNADTNASDAIVTAIAETEGVDPLEMDPLYDVLDPDALDGLFGSRTDGTPRRGGVCVEFRLNGYTVSLSSDRRIHVWERADT